MTMQGAGMVPDDFVSGLVQPFSAFGSKQKCVPRRLQKETHRRWVSLGKG